jgi:hypothetical protein
MMATHLKVWHNSGVRRRRGMRFTLTYDGDLAATGNKSRAKRVAEKKWYIRKHFHPQIAELCQTHSVLKHAIGGTWIPKQGIFGITQVHHSKDGGYPNPQRQPGYQNLYEPITVGKRRFLPIVRESMALVCGLKVLFLRKEEPGNLILQGGDLDNRIKTLFDGLRVPSEGEIIEDDESTDPILCLLENDSLITSFDIKTDRLLSTPTGSVHQVRLIVEVDINVTQAMLYNLSFLSG